MDALPNDPLMRRWWAEMADIWRPSRIKNGGSAAKNGLSYAMTLEAPRHVAVIDIGKTNAKVAVRRKCQRLAEIAVRSRPKRPPRWASIRQNDTDGLWTFILDGLGALNREQPSTRSRWRRTCPPARCLTRAAASCCRCLDYMSTTVRTRSPPTMTVSARHLPRPAHPACRRASISARRSSGSSAAFPMAFRGVSASVMYPQYWSFRLTGIAAMK